MDIDVVTIYVVFSSCKYNIKPPHGQRRYIHDILYPDIAKLSKIFVTYQYRIAYSFGLA